MLQNILTSKTSLLLLLAAASGVLLERDDASTQPSLESTEAQLYRPVLRPSESIPRIGTYMLEDRARKPCIKATLGVEYIVVERKRSWYFNLDPARVTTSGFCNKELALLSLTLPNSSASLQLNFRKEKKYFYVDKVEAHLSPEPICEKCANRTYKGLLVDAKLFMTADGQSFKCTSESLPLTLADLKVKLVPLQLQAFSVPGGVYGKEVECLADYNKRVVPIVIGAVVVGLLLIAMLTFLFIKDRRTQAYERI